MHARYECSCGKLIAQCRCIGPKPTIIVPNGCEECNKRESDHSTSRGI